MQTALDDAPVRTPSPRDSAPALPADVTLRLAITATFTAEPVEGVLRFLLGELGHRVAVSFADYQQVFQQLLDPTSLLSRNDGINLVLVRFEDWARFAATGDVDEAVRNSASELTNALRSFAPRSPAQTLVCVCPASPAFHDDATRRTLLEGLETQLRADLRELGSVHVVGTDAIEPDPVDPVHDSTRDRLGHIPYTPLFYTALGTALARRVHALKSVPHKVLALDCDNTLWQGVVGEDGPAGISLPPGKRFLQEFVVHQQSEGMLICLLSKNVERDVLEVFETRPDLPLKREHLVSWRVNWEPKSRNLTDLARELNLGTDSFIFLDDNPLECAEVRSAEPGVLTLELPPDEEIEGFLNHVWAFDRVKITDEDRERTALYRQNAERGRFENEAASLEAFLEGLGLRIDINVPTADELPRVAQLTQRTNQFNFTTVRRSDAEIGRLAEAGLECLRVRVADRFGDYGLVGIVIFSAGNNNDSLIIDTMLLSCRALGRGVEHVILAHLGRLAAGRGKDRVDARFVPTAKNQPALDFLESVGAAYAERNENEVWYKIPALEAAAVTYRPGCGPALPIENEAARTEPAPSRTAPGSPRFEKSRGYARLATELRDVKAVHNALRASERGVRPGSDTPPTAPRNEREQMLVALWKTVLNLDEVGIHDDFFRLGGTSLKAADLFAGIEATFGIRLPMTTILEAPTVADLALRVGPEASGALRETLKRLKPGGPGPALFLVHDGDGETLLYANLARRMPDHLAVYGLEPLGTDRCPILHTRIPDMAAHYARSIRDTQPEGPYFLGGMCAGGTIAFETALQLEAQGQRVGFVALLDSADPRAVPRAETVMSQRWSRFNQALQQGTRTNAPLVSRLRRKVATAGRKIKSYLLFEVNERLRRYSNARRFQGLRRAIDRGRPIPRRLENLSVRTVYVLAEKEYDPAATLRGHLVLFRATAGEGADQPFSSRFVDPLLGWGRRVHDGPETIDVTGGHASMLHEPNVARIAEPLAQLVNRLLASTEVTPSSATTQPTSRPRVLVVIVNYKTAELTRACLRTLEPELAAIPGARVTVVDNASGDADTLAAMIREHGWEGWVTLDASDQNLGFAYGNNRAIRPALENGNPPDYLFLLNADTEVEPGAINALLEFMDEHTDVGIAGSGLFNPDGSDWPFAFRFFSVASEFCRGMRLGLVDRLFKNRVQAMTMTMDREARVDWVGGAAMIIRRQVFDAIGLMDEGYFLYFEETDFCLRAARAGWPCWYVPRSRIMHHGSQSTRLSVRDAPRPRVPPYWFESRRRYFLKNHGLGKAVAADLAFVSAYSLFLLRAPIFRIGDVGPPHYLRDFWKHSALACLLTGSNGLGLLEAAPGKSVGVKADRPGTVAAGSRP